MCKSVLSVGNKYVTVIEFTYLSVRFDCGESRLLTLRRPGRRISNILRSFRPSETRALSRRPNSSVAQRHRFSPGRSLSLGSVSGELGLSKYLEGLGHTLTV